jgi:hypothetical protein
MESFFFKLAVAVIPLATLVISGTLTYYWSRQYKVLRFRAKRAHVAARHAFAVAATHKWL